MEPVPIWLAGCLSGMHSSIRASCSAPSFSTMSIALSIAHASVPMGTPTTFTPPRFAMRLSTPSSRAILVQCQYVPLRRQGHRFARVHRNTDAGQLSLRERHHVHVSDVTSTILMLMLSR